MSTPGGWKDPLHLVVAGDALVSAQRLEDEEVQLILSEEDYVACLESIIRRDYYPNAPEESTELETISSAWECAHSVLLSTLENRPDLSDAARNRLLSLRSLSSLRRLTVGGFCSLYTSEDNASFRHLLNLAQRRAAQNRPHLFRQSHDQRALPATTAHWNVAPMRNALMYGVGGATDLEPRIEKHVTAGSVNRTATRLQSEEEEKKANAQSQSLRTSAMRSNANSTNPNPSMNMNANSSSSMNPSSNLNSRRDVQSLVAQTPEILPDAVNVPMTWGEIAATPRATASHPGAERERERDSGGPGRFRIAGERERERVARRLAAAVSKTHAKRSRPTTSSASLSLSPFPSPSPRQTVTSSLRSAYLSPSTASSPAVRTLRTPGKQQQWTPGKSSQRFSITPRRE